MMNGRILRNALAAGVGGAAMLALPWAFVSCNDEDGGHADRAAVRTPVDSRTVSAPGVSTPETEIAEMPTIESAIPKRAESEPPREVTYEEAEDAFHAKRYTRAVELFTHYTERRSTNPWGYYMLGLSAWKDGDNERAEEAFERALTLDAFHLKSRLNLGRVLLDTNRAREALVQLDEALGIDPESNVTCRLRARAFRQLGRKNDAVASYRRALALDDHDAWSMNNLGLIFIEEERFDEALPPLARAVELSDDVAVFFNNLGMALEGTGHFRAAEEAYASAVTIDTLYDKAATNLERVAAVVEDPGVDPVDLGVLARRFADETAGDALVAGTQGERIAPAIVPVVASEFDSTGSGQDE